MVKQKSSVKHHIINFHNENASLVTFIDYVIGRQSGIYKASSSGSPIGKTNLDYQKIGKKNRVEIFKKVMREKARLAARKYIG